jgi:hypothetical protein
MVSAGENVAISFYCIGIQTLLDNSRLQDFGWIFSTFVVFCGCAVAAFLHSKHSFDGSSCSGNCVKSVAVPSI